jgi:hypothetical protein
MSMPEVLDDLPRRVGGWAVNRSLAPTSLTGISLALGLCAAAWFSAGTRPDNLSGALALFASYLAGRAARWLAGPGARAGARAAGARADGAGAAGAGAAGAGAGAGTLAELSGALTDCVVYAGLAVGGYEAHWSGTWGLAVAVVIAMAVRRTAAACGGQIADAGDGNLGRTIREFLAFSPGGRVAVIVIAAPIWGAHATLLALLEWGIIATAYVITGHGPRRVAAASAGLAGRAAAVGPPVRLASSAPAELPSRTESSVQAGLPSRTESSARADLPARAELPSRAELAARVDSPPAVMDMSVAADPPAWADAPVPADPRARADPSARARSSAPVDAPAAMGPPGLSTSAALTSLASGAGLSETPLPLAGSPEPTMTLELMIHREPDRRREPEPPTVLDPRARAVIAAYRDDGAAAVWLSRVVRGQFVPLPPAVAGLAATSFLAWLGMRNLPGILLLTPLVVMLLAAFGSSHPHDGRLDWLVPAVLVAGQLVYVAAIGFSFGVPPPLTFTLCSLIALRYVGLPRDDLGGAAADTRLGWEGRMLAVGIGAMLGITTIAYAALVVYVGVLICGRARASLLTAGRAELR